MNNPDCIFCKIAEGELPSTKIYEDEEFIVIFDAFPHVEGQGLLISKDHFGSRFEELPDEILQKAILVAKNVSQNLKKAFTADRVVQLTEGLQIAHMHMKLFPVQDPKKFGMGSLSKNYPQAKEPLSAEKYKELKEKFEKGL